MNLEEILKNRYATKLFDGKKINEQKIEKLFELILLSPSSYNLQPWKIKVIEDQKTKERLFSASYNQKQITSCSHLLVFCANLNIEENIRLLEEKLLKTKQKNEIEEYIEVLKNFASFLKGEKRLLWAQKQVYLIAQTTLIAAKYLGFDSCPMEGFEPEKYKEILNLPKELVPTLVIPIGYAADKPREKIRFEKNQVFF
ncbi:MAG: nitroreductase family protein [Candidatus Anstonellaceae archaeon]